MDSRLDQTFLIDVSEEDDSLLPDKAIHRDSDGQQVSSSGHTVDAVEAPDVIQKDNLLFQGVPNGVSEEQGNFALPVMTEEPVLVKKKKTGFNVRKSLAWNNAFFTEEGVLDCEELSLVNRTFQKPLGLPKPITFKKPIQPSKIVKPPPMMPKINVISHNPDLTAESKVDSAARSLSSNLTRSLPTSSEQHVNNTQGLNSISQGLITSVALANVQIESSNKEKALVEAHADFSEPKLPLRRSFDRKIQGASVSASPGIHHCNGENHLSVIGTDSNVQASTASDLVINEGDAHLKRTAKPGSLFSQRVNKEAMRQSSLSKLTGNCVSSITVARAHPVPSSSKLNSEIASTKAQHAVKKSTSLEPGAFASREKPSGLRMPSPKLGFFDSKRTASQITVSCEKTGHGFGVTGFGRSSKDIEIGSSRHSTNQIQRLKHPAKPTDELLEASRRQTVEIRRSSNIPSAPHVHGHSAEVAATRVTPTQELPRSASYPSNWVNKKVDRGEQILQARKNGNAWGKPVRNEPATFIQRNARGQENFSPSCKNGNGMLQKCKVAGGLAFGNLNMKNSGKTCYVEVVQKALENVQAVLEPLQKSESRMVSSTSQDVLGEGIAEELVEKLVIEPESELC